MEMMSNTCFEEGIKTKINGEWPGLKPNKWPTSRKIVERPNTSEDYYSSIIK